jgi:hypothetical protein
MEKCRGGSAADLTWRIWNRELSADSLSEQVRHFSMSRDGLGVPGLWILPKRVLFALSP